MSTPPDRARRRAVIRLGAFVCFVALAVIAGLLLPLPSTDEIQDAAGDAGWLGAVAFVVGYGLVTLTPIPKNVVGIAAGLTWGFGLGSVLVYLGALIGAALAFAIGRALGREAVERLIGGRVERIDDVLRRRGLLSVIGARLIPVLPFTAINYAASLTAVSRRDYAVGTAVGIIPGTLAYVAIGAFGFEGGPGLYLGLGVLGVLTLVGVVVTLRKGRASRATDLPPADDGQPGPASDDRYP